MQVSLSHTAVQITLVKYVSGGTRGTSPTRESMSKIVLQTSKMEAALDVVNIYDIDS
jgi:hypothetical protein